MTSSPSPPEVLLALERTMVLGCRVEGGAVGLFCDARFLPAPHLIRDDGPPAPDDDAPYLKAALDLFEPRTLLRSTAVGRYSGATLQRFPEEREGEAVRLYGYVSLASPEVCELACPYGVELASPARWESRPAWGDSDLIVGADLLSQGTLVYVGGGSSLLYPHGGAEPVAAAFAFLLPRYEPLNVRRAGR